MQTSSVEICRISEEHRAYIFRVDEWAVSKKHVLKACILGFLFVPEDGGIMFLWNVGKVIS
jgi:hypothetical protein